MLNKIKIKIGETLGLKNLVYNDKYESLVGYKSKNPIFEDGEYGVCAGAVAENPIFEDGEYEVGAGYEAVNPIFEDGEYGENTLMGAEDIKAYIKKAESIVNPRSGYIIADDVKEIILDDEHYTVNSKDIFVYTTKDNVSGKYAESSAYISKEDLKSILKEVDYEHFKDIKDYKTLSSAMDQVFGRVNEKSEYFERSD